MEIKYSGGRESHGTTEGTEKLKGTSNNSYSVTPAPIFMRVNSGGSPGIPACYGFPLSRE
jgi:hypothetical protein